MDTAVAVTTQPVPSSPRVPVASALHTIFFLLVLCGAGVMTYLSTGRVRSIDHPSRVFLYLSTIIWEWLLVTYVLFGVRRHGTPLVEVTGARWMSSRDFFRDVGIALAFWVVALVALGAVSYLLGFHGMKQNVRLFSPEGLLEITLWVALSVTAGICEETLFRGYLQRQFIAWSDNVPAGVLLSAAVFGGAHIYQGWKATIVIGVYGLLFGTLAHWRSSVRPGMMTHALHDAVSGLAAKLLPR